MLLDCGPASRAVSEEDKTLARIKDNVNYMLFLHKYRDFVSEYDKRSYDIAIIFTTMKKINHYIK